MKTKKETHTPGPWTVAPPFDDRGALNIRTVDSPQWYIARITLSGGGGPAQHEANARLIAAAPRMAKALYRIAEVFGINDANLNDDQKEALREAAEAHDQAVRP